MPLYEYRCRSCGADFEVMRARQLMDAAVACPACASTSSTRKLSVFAPLRIAVAPPGDPDFKNPYGDDDDDDFEPTSRDGTRDRS